jgi:hypothetical protein
LEQHKPQFSKGCSELFDLREINGDNLNSVRSKGRRYLKNERREYIYGKINEP